MVSETTAGEPINRISGALHRRPRLRLALLLGLPMLWLGGVYGGSLVALLSQSFFSLDDFSGTIDRTFTMETWGDLFTDSNISIAIRTTVMATAVTIGAAIIAFPIAYYAVRYAGRRLRAVFFVLILIPLWSSYLVRVLVEIDPGARESCFGSSTNSDSTSCSTRLCRLRVSGAFPVGIGARPVHRVRLHLVALHDLADPCRPGAGSEVVP